MILFLRCFFTVVLASMLWVTSWATLGQSLPDFIRGPVSGDRWFIATLFDAYWGFLTFFVWVAYKETRLLVKALWLLGILLLGNIAMSVYCLIQLFRVRTDAPLSEVLLRRPSL
ncbi:MAG: DUF1475 family protein [Opitutaceae bacterium]|nr:DUF1475 family protein [Opitutaceae bacterium]